MIRKATEEDLSRIAEIFVFNNRINYFPIFKQEEYSFGELQVVSLIENYFGKTEIMDTLFVAEDNGIIKGFMEIRGTEIGKLYVEPCFQSGGVGDVLIKYAIQNEFGDNADVDEFLQLEKEKKKIYEDFKNGQFQNKSEGFNKLMKKYTSEVSPDRKGIITSGLKAVSRNKQSGLKPIDLLATILEGMLMCGKVTYKNLIDSRPLFRIFFGEIFSKALDYNVAQ